MRNLKLTTILLSMILLLSCHDDNELITLNRIVVKNVINLPIPNKHVLDCWVKIVNDNNRPIVLAQFYPLKKLFIYDLKKKELISEINVSKNVQNIQYINADSIWLLYYEDKYYNYDSALVLMDINGKMKQYYSFYHPNIFSLKLYPYLPTGNFNEELRDSILFIYNNQYFSNLIYNNKLFFTSINYENGKKNGYSRLPIAGYYDISTNQIVFNKKLFYPFIDNTTYYPYNARVSYYEVDGVLNHKNNFLLTFRYSPTIYEWNINTNENKTFRVASKFIDTIYSYKSPIKNLKEESAYYLGMFYAKKLNMYIRYAVLDEKYGSQSVIIFADTNYNYLGEALYSIDYSIHGEYNNNFYNASIVSDSLQIKFFEFEFKKLNVLSLRHQIDSIQKKIILEKNNEYCKITGNKEYNKHYSIRDFIKYVKYKGIKDSSFALLIISQNACPSCNDYIVKNISINQNVFFNFHEKPFYLLYICENEVDFKEFLKEYNLKVNKNIINDKLKTYKYFNPFNEANPRLVLVKNNKIISDTIYMPDQLEKLIERLMNFYGAVSE